jgi:hypothetical protein
MKKKEKNKTKNLRATARVPLDIDIAVRRLVAAFDLDTAVMKKNRACTP